MNKTTYRAWEQSKFPVITMMIPDFKRLVRYGGLTRDPATLAQPYGKTTSERINKGRCGLSRIVYNQGAENGI